ncbi:MAG: hypothetical protein J6A62_06685 [Oscillospiraceae bacterium]|nr:hypothetical protein [Oscillospiraceae bacterium]
MKRLKTLFTCILLGAMLLPATGCANTEPKAAHPDGYVEYSALLAHDWSAALDALNLSEDEMMSGGRLGKGVWDTGKQVEYCGADLGVRLYTWTNEPDYVVFQGFSYQTFLSSDLHEAAQVISTIAKQITEAQGNANDYKGLRDITRIADMSVEEIEELLKKNQNRGGSKVNAWALGFLDTQEGQKLQNWVKENSQRYRGEPLDLPQFILKMTVHFAETPYLELKYELASLDHQGLIAQQ